MPRFELLFPSKFVKGVDFATGPRVVTIKAVLVEEIETNLGKNKKAMMYFEEILAQSLILNVTNAKTIASMYGSETNDWIGKKVTLVMAQTTAKGGETVDCVRVQKGIPVENKVKK
jgi:hypothetical protein